MVNAKIKLIMSTDGYEDFQGKVNRFLTSIDVRQIIKTDVFIHGETSAYRMVIWYVNFEDIRDIKIDKVINF